MSTEADDTGLDDAGLYRRRSLGVVAGLFLLIGVAQWVFQPFEGKADGFRAVCMRVGLLFGAIWLAYPELRRIPAWMLNGFMVGAAVVALRPRLAFIVVPALFLLYGLRMLTK